MKPEIEQELSHTLLTELLAYQFASPVKWIETQDVFLKEYKTERIVEIGPSPILCHMALKTIKNKYESYDAALSLQRQVLCYSKDNSDIYYTPDAAELEEEGKKAAARAGKKGKKVKEVKKVEKVEKAEKVEKVEKVEKAEKATPAAATPSSATSQIPDEPIKAEIVVKAIVAHKLKKSIDEVPMDKTIKDLVGGKSTVQNEIVGELGKELGNLPEKPEDMPLQELCDTLQETFAGGFGKVTSSLVARLISSKMPGGFSVGATRRYLETRWGLQGGRQDAVLLYAVTGEPGQRLAGEPEVRAFFDGLVTRYAARAGVDLTQAQAGAGTGAPGGAGAAPVVDAAAMEKLTAGSRNLARQQLETLARYLKMDLTKGDRSLVKQKEATAVLQAQLDLWAEEHGEYYASGIKPAFSRLKARVYDSYWNWARQDALSMYYDIIFGNLRTVDRETVRQCIQIMNRANPTLIEFMQYHIDHTPVERGETYELAKRLGQQLTDNCREVLGHQPVYKDVSRPTGPKTTIDERGNVQYAEVPKEGCRKFEQYVHEMAQGGAMTKDRSYHSIQEDLVRVYKAISKQASGQSKLEFEKMYKRLIDFVDSNTEIEVLKSAQDVLGSGVEEGGDEGEGEEAELSSADDTSEIASLKEYSEIKRHVSATIPPETIPFLHLRRKNKYGEWSYDRAGTEKYLDELENAAVNGVSFAGKCALVVGAGKGSIGVQVLQGLLSGGAKVVATTSKYSKEAAEYYQDIYARYGAAGSTLVLVPFNQASVQDLRSIVEYIYDDPKKGGLGWDLDFVVPFAAIPEMGIELDSLESKSELAHRIMLTNLLRLLGEVVKAKRARQIETRPAEVILPLSPNHGTFGSDGMYSESKLALETLFNRWHSESWSSYLTICGAVIGWTRGTGLMSGNNVISEGIERLGVRTFSQREMGFNLLGLLSPRIKVMTEKSPVMADLNGGLQFVTNLREYTNRLRAEIGSTSDVRRAVSIETALDYKCVSGEQADAPFNPSRVQPKANMRFEFPELKPYDQLKAKAPELEGMLDLDRVVVVTGFSEVGPWGNSRTRWEMEAEGEFSLEGCVEMAWIMGFIRYFNGRIKGRQYTGWVDAKTGQPVADLDIKKRYEKQILAHCGIRLIEPELFDGYDPNKKEFLQEVIIQQDLEPFVSDGETARQFRLQHGDKVEIFALDESGEEYSVRLLKGARLFVPKALRFDRLVAGQIPTGWDPKKYGIPADIVDQVDPLTLFVLVATVEALLSAGITDPYEFYRYVHVSEVGNCTGSGMGGVTALRGMFKARYKDIPVQNDILQESFINTVAAWVNMLLLSSSGPIKTPVGACATAIESVDAGVETILSGKAKIVLVGGADDFGEEGSYEFANMKATSNAVEEFEHGRTPAEMSRPATTTRNGFMESQGSGIEVLMTASLAIRMGVPIYGIVAMSSTASDKIGRSVPAPGQGILTTAREYHGDLQYRSPQLDIKYRARQIRRRRKQVKEWYEDELRELEAGAKHEAPSDVARYLAERTEELQREAARQIKDAQRQYGNEFWKDDPRISPLRGALATFGLTIDDLGVCSFHGTSTKANDKNESETIDRMMQHLGRTPGNAVYGVFQKYLTGHPKGAAGAWMLNGALQIMQTGLVPGNRNADNIDKQLENYKFVLFPSRSIQTDGIKAVSVTSFGFGQKGAQAVVVNSDYLFAALSRSQYDEYSYKVARRHKKSYSYMQNALLHNNMFVAKAHPPYTDSQEQQVYLDPLARVSQDNQDRYSFDDDALQKSSMYVSSTATKTAGMLSDLLQARGAHPSAGVGVDVEMISAINTDSRLFIERNFTPAEIAYCEAAPDPRASFAGRWSAKEAVFKALNTAGHGAAAALKDIEVLADANGAPVVNLTGSAKVAAKESSIRNVKVSISHDDMQSLAVAISD